jgi:hypothetical protein
VSIQYLILFIVLLIPILFWNVWNICCFDSFEINDTSATYLLSALVQGQAAIIAIIVTLTLVAVQITASAYSPRVIDIFKENKVMWWLLVLYGISIFFGLFVLETIGGEYQNLSHWGISLEFCVFFAYLMGVTAFAGLFWHIGNVINLLKPENVINRLSDKITKYKNLEYISYLVDNEKYPKKSIKKCPAQPIIDIIYRALRKYDIETVRYGLGVVTDWAKEVIDQVDPDNDLYTEKLKYFSEDFCGYLMQFVRLSVKTECEEVVTEVIYKLETFASPTAEKELEDATMSVIICVMDSLESIKQIVVETKWRNATRAIAECIGMIGYYTVRFKEEQICIEKTGQVVESLTAIGEIAAKNRFEFAVVQAAQFIEYIGIDATYIDRLENSVLLENIVLQAAQSLVKLTNLSKYVKEVIECPKPTLLEYEKDCDRQSFMKLYKQELEKSRNKVSK